MGIVGVVAYVLGIHFGILAPAQAAAAAAAASAGTAGDAAV